MDQQRIDMMAAQLRRKAVVVPHRDIHLPGMAVHLLANHRTLAHELVPLSGFLTNEQYIEVLAKRLLRELTDLGNLAFRRKYQGKLVYCKG